MKIKQWRYALLGLLTVGMCLWLSPVLAELPSNAPSLPRPASIVEQPTDGLALEQQAQILYESGQYTQAIPLLQQAVQLYQHQGNALRQGVALSNLALVYQQAGQGQAANQTIAISFELLQRIPETAARQQVLAQTLSIQAHLQLAQGKAESALQNWEQATTLYQQQGNSVAVLQSQINQAQALQALGLYRRAIALLTDLSNTPQLQPFLAATILRSLGDALQVTGDLVESRQALEQALQILEPLPPVQTQEAIAATQLSLANLTRIEATTQLNLSALSPAAAIQILTTSVPSRTLAETALRQRQTAVAQRFVQQSEAALKLYQQAAQQALSASTRIQAQLNQLNTLIELQRWAEARPLIETVEMQVNTLPLDQTSIYQRISLAIDWLQLERIDQTIKSHPEETHSAQLLTIAAEQAATLGDARAQSFALGNLGNLYEQTRTWEKAESLTQQAVMLAQSINAADVSYRWQWQLGRLLNQREDRAGAIAAYAEAIRSLQALRNDLVAVNRDVQFSFQAQIEPVYREFVDLLLSSPNKADISLLELVQAREVIEGLQIAELDNFFREACLETQFEIDRVVDRANLSAAIFYTIVLPDRLEVILKLPQRDLIRYTTWISQTEVEVTVDELLAELKRPYLSQRLQGLSQQVYDWLIRPAEPLLNETPMETLVFVLDSALRNLPIAALSDGQHFLVENYSIALAPGLQLTDPKPLQERRFNVLVAGLSEARANFSALNFVAQEIQDIQAEVPSKVLFNQSFTQENLQKQLDASTFSIVHIATHGQFSSNAAETFILAWDRPINVNELSNLLQAEEVTSPEPIELLVLSACRTAVGDRRAALGMAGMAVRAGARSTIASLWNLDDDSGAVLMEQFYRELRHNPISKAEALRRAQRALLADPQYAAPRFWAPYILLGNWL